MKFPHNIDFKLFKIDSENIIFDTLNASIFHVSDIVADILEVGKHGDPLVSVIKGRYTEADISAALYELDCLQSEGYLPDKCTEKSLDISDRKISMVMLNVIHGCNLACKYCYEDAGTFGDKKLNLMTKDVANRSLDFLIANSSDKLLLKFFGGEPLLNFDLIKYVVKTAREKFANAGKKVLFELQTNGVLVTEEIAEYIAKNIESVGVSYDPYSDSRIFRDGRNAEQAIERGIKILLSKRADTGVRVTIANNNKDLFSKSFDHLVQLGFKQERISFEGAFTSTDQSLAINKFDFLDAFHKLVEERISNIGRFDLKDPVIRKVLVNPYMIQSLPQEGCALGRTLMTIDIDGRMYSCHRDVPHPYFLIGDVFNGFNEQRNYFSSIGYFEKCKSCWARKVCGIGGQCNWFHVKRNGYFPTEPAKEHCDTVYTSIQRSISLVKKHIELEKEELSSQRSQASYKSIKEGDIENSSV